jgi:hypothetical protein
MTLHILISSLACLRRLHAISFLEGISAPCEIASCDSELDLEARFPAVMVANRLAYRLADSGELIEQHLERFGSAFLRMRAFDDENRLVVFRKHVELP